MQYAAHGYGPAAENNGNVRSQTVTVPALDGAAGFTAVQTYAYDPLNRIETARETQGTEGGAESWKQRFTYDHFGNRRIDGDASNPAASQTTPALVGPNPLIDPATNRLSSPGYSYDAAGNLTGDARHTYEYDSENRMAANDRGGDPSVAAVYAYDGDGRRVRKVAGAGTGAVITVFVYDAAGRLVAEYSNAAPSPVPGGKSYLTQDHLGSTRVVTGQDKGVRSRHDYLPFGEEINVATVTNSGREPAQGYHYGTVRQKFTGYERDTETGLDYAQARYYSNVQGRFTSVDPLMASGHTSSPQSWNRYAYSYNNPLRFTDPSGMLAADYYNDEAKRIGTDGVKDGKAYFVTDEKEAKQIEATDKKGGTTQVSSVSSALELPSHGVRQEVGVAAVARSNKPGTTDPTGKRHEEGGVVIDTAGGQLAVAAHPGPLTDPLGNAPATINVLNVVNPQLLSQVKDPLADFETTYHIHPAGTASVTTDTSRSGGGTTVFGSSQTRTGKFDQGPSSPADYKFASQTPTRLGYHIVVGARDKNVYFYNASGVLGKMPLNKFVSIK